MSEAFEEFRPWLILGLQQTGTFKTVYKFRFRNYAEAQCRELNRRMPGYFLVAYEPPKNESDRCD